MDYLLFYGNFVFFFVSFTIIEVSIKPIGGHTAQGELEFLSPPTPLLFV